MEIVGSSFKNLKLHYVTTYVFYFNRVYLFRRLRCLHVYECVSQGREWWYSLHMTTDSRYCLRELLPSVEPRNVSYIYLYSLYATFFVIYFPCYWFMTDAISRLVDPGRRAPLPHGCAKPFDQRHRWQIEVSFIQCACSKGGSPPSEPQRR